MEANRELVRWLTVALSSYVGVLALVCPCKTIFGCHQKSASVAVLALGVLTVWSSGILSSVYAS
jgi:uncharacterized membrane protein